MVVVPTNANATPALSTSARNEIAMLVNDRMPRPSMCPSCQFLHRGGLESIAAVSGLECAGQRCGPWREWKRDTQAEGKATLASSKLLSDL